MRKFFGFTLSPWPFVLGVVGAMLIALCTTADAQLQPKMVTIGELVFRSRLDLGPAREVFRQELHNLGYVEGKNITFETRSAEGKLDRYPALAHELARLKVDVLVATSTTEAIAFKDATKTIPIVFIVGSDPITDGLVDSLARPGQTSQVLLILRWRRLENDWSCSKKRCPKSSGLRSSTIQTIGETHSRWMSFRPSRDRWG